MIWTIPTTGFKNYFETNGHFGYFGAFPSLAYMEWKILLCFIFLFLSLSLSLSHTHSFTCPHFIKPLRTKTKLPWIFDASNSLSCFSGSPRSFIGYDLHLCKSNPTVGYPLLHLFCSLLPSQLYLISIFLFSGFHVLPCFLLCFYLYSVFFLFCFFISWMLLLLLLKSFKATTATAIMKLADKKFRPPLLKQLSSELFMLLWYKAIAQPISSTQLLPLFHALLLTSLLKITLFSLLWVLHFFLSFFFFFLRFFQYQFSLLN